MTKSLALLCKAAAATAVLTGAALAEIAPPPVITGDAADTQQGLPAPTYGGALSERSTLTGDWGGGRDKMAENGLTLDLFSTSFATGLANGGRERGMSFGSRLDAYVNLDGQRAGLWPGLFLTMHAEALFGDTPTINERAGAVLPPVFPMGVPTGDPSEFAVTSFVVTQFLSENSLVYLGKINTVDDSNQPYVGGGMGLNGFMNANFLNNPILVRTVPYSTWGGGIAYLQNFEPILSLNVYDTNNTPTSLGWDEIGSNGATWLMQGRLPTDFGGKPGSHSLTLVYSSGDYIATRDLGQSAVGVILGLLPELPREDGSKGITYQFDQALWVDPVDAERRFGVFCNIGVSDGSPNPIKWAANIGIAGSNPWAKRPGDSMGFGYFYTSLSDDLKGFPGRLALQNEQGIEAFYNFGLAPWANLTADIQVIEPMFETLDTDVILGLRLKIAL